MSAGVRRWGATRLMLVLALAAGVVVAYPATPALAATFQVTLGPDLPDWNPGDGICSTAPAGHCSLRAAFMELSELEGAGHRVFVEPGTYTLDLSGDSLDGSDGALYVQDAGFTLAPLPDPTVPPGAITIDATALGDRVMHFSSDEPIQLERVVLTGGSTARPDGVTNHWGASGGAIRHVRGSLTVLDSTIEGNQTGDDGRGGGIAVRDANLTLQNVTFTGNASEGGSGGALLFERTSSAAAGGPTHARVTGGAFTSNNAAVDGGAISVEAPNGTLTVTGTTFTDNRAPQGDGGAIHLHRFSDAEIVGATFSGNRAAVGGGGHGGAVRMVEMIDATSTARVRSSTFTANVANTGGGVSSGPGTDLEVIASLFDGNRAPTPLDPPSTRFPGAAPICSCGGAIAAEGAGSLTLINTSMLRNRTGSTDSGIGVGGGLYVEESDLAVSGAAPPPPAGSGPVPPGRCPRSDTPCATADSNVAGNAGGGLFARTGTTRLSDVIVGDRDLSTSPDAGNVAGRFGGGLVLVQDGGASVPASITRATIQRNRAATGGGLVTARDVTISDSRIESNWAHGGPGGAIFQAEGSLAIDGTQIRGRGSAAVDAVTNGGGIAQRCQPETAPGPIGPPANCEPAEFDATYTADRPLSLKVTATTIRNVNASGSGGALSLEEGTSTLARTVVAVGRAGADGAGIALNRAGVVLEATEVSIEDNAIEGVGAGAGLALGSGSSATLVRSAVLRNRTGGNGGGISVNDATLVTENVTISANRSSLTGGGLSVRAGSDVTLKHTALAFNASVDPGGASVAGSALELNASDLHLDRSFVATNRGVACSWANLTGSEVTAESSAYDEDEDQDFRGSGFGVQSCEKVFTGTGNLPVDLRERLRLGFVFVPEESVGLNALRLNGGRSLTHSLRLQSALIDLNPNWHPDSYRFRDATGAVNVPQALTDVLLDALGDPPPSELPPLKPLPDDDGPAPRVEHCPVQSSNPALDQRSFDRPRDGDGDGRACVDVGPYEFVQGVQVEEGAGAAEVGPNGREVGEFVIERMGDLTKRLDVDYVVTGTATPGEDYAALSGALTFQPGETRRIISIVPVLDDEVEEPETVTITLLSRLKYSLGRQSRATIRILDADPGVTVTATDPTASEVGNDTGEFTFARGGVTDAPLEVFFRVGGTAAAGLDYEALPTTVIIPAGESETPLFIRPIPDEDEDQGETITIEIEPDPTYVIGNPSSALVTIEDAEPVVTRIEGEDRIETAIAVSKATFAGGGASSVVLARADLFPDALAGGPLAQNVGGPMLLTPPDGLDERVAGEIDRLGVDVVYLLGGESALSRQVARDLVALGVQKVERFGGEDRFATAALIAAEVIGDGTLAYIVEGQNADPARGWPDAVSASGLASAEQRPILLVTTDTMPAATRDAIRDLGITQARIVGGPVAVSLAVERHLERDLDLDLVRLAGQDRFETSRVVAELAAASGLNPQFTWLATGAKFPDALVAGPAAAATGGVLLLVHESELARSEATEQWLRSRPLPGLVVRLVGGPGAISTAIENTLRAMIAR